jgi:hypothetical protein
MRSKAQRGVNSRKVWTELAIQSLEGPLSLYHR